LYLDPKPSSPLGPERISSPLRGRDNGRASADWMQVGTLRRDDAFLVGDDDHVCRWGLGTEQPPVVR